MRVVWLLLPLTRWRRVVELKWQQIGVNLLIYICPLMSRKLHMVKGISLLRESDNSSQCGKLFFQLILCTAPTSLTPSLRACPLLSSVARNVKKQSTHWELKVKSTTFFATAAAVFHYIFTIFPVFTKKTLIRVREFNKLKAAMHFQFRLN